MNNKYRVTNLSGYNQKANDGNYGKTIVVGSMMLAIVLIIWLVSDKAQTTNTESHSLTNKVHDALTNKVHDALTNKVHDVELPATPSPNINPSAAILNAQLNRQLVPVIEQPIFLNQLSTPYGFATDPIHNRLIWTSGGNETFMSAKLDGSEVTIIQSNFEAPYLIRFETPFGHKMLFYADGSLWLREIDSQMDTSSETALLRLQEHELHGLGFDDIVNTVYLGDEFGQPSLAILIPTGDEPVVAIPMTLLNSK